MRIEIPENIQQFGVGATHFHSLCYMQIILRIAARKLDKTFAPFPINDIKATEANILLRIISNLESFQTLCLIGKDYSACCTLARSIADSIIAIKLIYQSTDDDEKVFRHYLYVLDGLILNKKLLHDDLENNGRITDEEFQSLSKQYETARQKFNEGIEFCNEILQKHPYKTAFPEFFNAAVENGSWKYKEKRVKVSNKQIPCFSWEKLYSLIDNRPSIISMYSLFLSQFVHGLSISNMSDNNDVDNFESLASCVVCLQGLVADELKQNFNDDNKLLEYMTDKDIQDIMALHTPERRLQIMEEVYAKYNGK